LEIILVDTFKTAVLNYLYFSLSLRSLSHSVGAGNWFTLLADDLHVQPKDSRRNVLDRQLSVCATLRMTPPA